MFYLNSYFHFKFDGDGEFLSYCNNVIVTYLGHYGELVGPSNGDTLHSAKIFFSRPKKENSKGTDSNLALQLNGL